MIAILPAGGRGTRMAAVTAGKAKEALMLGDRTVLDRVLDEAFACGAERAVVVSSRDKAEVEAIVSARPEVVDLRYQEEAKGLAHAIASAGEFENDALILLPDTVFAPAEASLGLCHHTFKHDAVVLSQTVPESEVSLYGILETDGQVVRKILEKPQRTETQSRLAVAARYRLSDRVMRLLKEYVNTPIDAKEWDLTTVLNRALLNCMEIETVTTTAKRFDCGNPEGYAEAQAYFAR